MINPQMGLPEVPTVKELWKNEKSKYRHWILLFGIGIAAVFALQLTAFIINMVNMDSIKDSIETNLKETYKNVSDSDVNAAFNSTFLIGPIIQLVLVGLGLVYFLTTVYASYKNHSFAKISQWATMVIGIGAFIAIFQLLQLSWRSGSRTIFDTPGGVFQFVNYFLMIGVYFGASVKVSKIRREFAVSERVEQLKNDPAFQQQMEMYKNMMQNGQMQMGPMGPMVNPMAPPVQPGQQPVNQPITPAEPQISKEEADLKEMTVVELKDVAKELSISGYSDMKKAELIKAILRVTEK